GLGARAEEAKARRGVRAQGAVDLPCAPSAVSCPCVRCCISSAAPLALLGGGSNSGENRPNYHAIGGAGAGRVRLGLGRCGSWVDDTTKGCTMSGTGAPGRGARRLRTRRLRSPRRCVPCRTGLAASHLVRDTCPGACDCPGGAWHGS